MKKYKEEVKGDLAQQIQSNQENRGIEKKKDKEMGERLMQEAEESM